MNYPQIWRTFIGLICIHIVFFGATFGIIIGASKLLDIPAHVIIDGSTPSTALSFFATFIGYHVGLFLVVKLLHKRAYRSLFGTSLRINWRHFRNGIGIILATTIASWIISIILHFVTPSAAMPNTIQQFEFGQWALLLLPALLVIFIQIMAEELVFRGYVLQQLRARFNSVWIWAVLPSFLFGAMHFDDVTYGYNAYFYVLHTTIVGILLSLVTLRTGNIGAAAGLHFANNASLIILGNAGALEGMSLFVAELTPTGAYMTQSILSQTLIAVVAFAIWWRKTKLPYLQSTIANAATSD